MILLVIAVIFQLLARNLKPFAQWYAVHVYPVFVQIFGRISAIVPWSLVEILLYLLIVVSFAGMVRSLFWTVKQRKKISDMLLGWMSYICLTVGTLFFIYTMTCGINYHRTSFAESVKLETSSYSLEELTAAAQYLTDELNKISEEVDRNEQGLFRLKQDGKADAVKAMDKLGETYEVLKGYYPKPKAVMLSEILSYQQLTGIYSPFTIEANYNADMPDYNIPFTMCHELSHLRGFMSEDEANFIAYLACIESGQKEMKYSGAMLGWLYVTNALYEESPELYQAMREQLKEEILLDYQENSAFWDSYEGSAAEVADKVNDTYLKANKQTDGVKSYGKVVDLMLAYYLKQN